MKTEFVTNRQWMSYAMRVLREAHARGEALSLREVTERALPLVVETFPDRQGMLVQKGWREVMRQLGEPSCGNTPSQ